MKEKLIERSYPEQLIEKNFDKARKRNRKDLINQPRRQKKKDDKVRMITTYNEGNPPFHQWIREGKKLLERNEKAKEMGNRIQLSTRQPKNLRRMVSASNFVEGGPDPPTQRGCFKCNKCRVACPILKEGNRFISTNTGKSYMIEHHLTCDSSWVVYLGTCKGCKGQYVGKSTTKFKVRHSNHKQEVKRNYGGLGHHYGGVNGCGYDQISIQIIEQVEVGNNHLG